MMITQDEKAAIAREFGGPAFPEVAYKAPVGGGAHMMTISGGMTLRDYFAAKAMQSIVVLNGGNISTKSTALHAYEQADAMLEARK